MSTHKNTLTFKKVIIENVGGYFGAQEIAFPQGGRNILMIRGSNTAGKTSLMNGLKWCLFNQVSTGRSDATLDPFEMYNAKALRKGAEHHMRVAIEADYGGSPLVIERRAGWHYKKTAPQKYEDLDIQFTVTRTLEDGTLNPLPQDDSERFIRQIAPPVLGRFFLFDGELLDEYRDLVSHAAHSGKNPELGRAIEGVLGLPTLEKAQGVLKQAVEAARKRTRSLAKSKDSDTHRGLIDDWQKSIEALNEEIGDIEDTQDQKSRELSSTRREMESYEQAEQDFVERDQLKRRLAEIDHTIEQHAQALQGFSAYAWHDLAKPALESLLENITQRTDDLANVSQDVIRRDHLEELRRRLLDEGACPVCERTPDTQTREHIQGILDQIEASQDHQRQVQQDREDLIAERKGVHDLLKRLSPIKQEYQHKIERINEDQTAHDTVSDQLDELRSRSSSVTQEQIKETREREAALNREMGQLDQSIQQKKRQISDLEEKIRNRQTILEQEAGDYEQARKIRAVQQRLDRMDEVVKEARGRQAEAMRQKVEQYTSHAYRAMTHEKHHQRVKIAPQTFGMTIIDDQGDPVEKPSAGATQILALALIISLGQIGRKLGPLIMDTPLGRLDSEHRINVLEYLPKHSHQVALLYHDGEIDKVTYDRIRSKIGQAYLIYKLQGENTSRIEADLET